MLLKISVQKTSNLCNRISSRILFQSSVALTFLSLISTLEQLNGNYILLAEANEPLSSKILVIVYLQKRVRLLALWPSEFLEAHFFPTTQLVKGHPLS